MDLSVTADPSFREVLQAVITRTSTLGGLDLRGLFMYKKSIAVILICSLVLGGPHRKHNLLLFETVYLFQWLYILCRSRLHRDNFFFSHQHPAFISLLHLRAILPTHPIFLHLISRILFCVK